MKKWINGLKFKKTGLSVVAAAAIGIAIPYSVDFEGWHLKPYKDPIGITTVCGGTTRIAGLPVTMDMKFTDEECELLAQEDMTTAVTDVERLAPIKWKPYQLAAFGLFYNNVGPGRPGKKDGFLYLKSGRRSTMYNKIMAGDMVGACEQLKYWNKAGGKVLNGLTKRRAIERGICLRGL